MGDWEPSSSREVTYQVHKQFSKLPGNGKYWAGVVRRQWEGARMQLPEMPNSQGLIVQLQCKDQP